MSWPGTIPKGLVVKHTGSHLDLLPTICKAAGVAVPADRTIDGTDALGMAVGQAGGTHDALYWSGQGQLGVRRGNWKLVKDGRLYDGTPDGNKPLTGDDALFLSNLDEDPGESTNLRHKYPRMVDELATMAQRWLEDVKQP
jgi:arylsulfatase A-like enzyme